MPLCVLLLIHGLLVLSSTLDREFRRARLFTAQVQPRSLVNGFEQSFNDGDTEAPWRLRGRGRVTEATLKTATMALEDRRRTALRISLLPSKIPIKMRRNEVAGESVEVVHEVDTMQYRHEAPQQSQARNQLLLPLLLKLCLRRAHLLKRRLVSRHLRILHSKLSRRPELRS